jgi:hypothetical protein
MAAAHDADSPPRRGAPTPLGQRLYDNTFLLLAAGILIMVAVYTGWGIWEIVTMPPATLP